MIEAAKVQPAITVTADENWVECTMRYVVDYKERRAIKSKIFTRIMEEFEKTDGLVQIASTSMNIQLMESPRLAEQAR